MRNSPQIRKRIYEMFGGKCAYCGGDLDFNSFHVDHVLPKCKGGKDSQNRFPSCPTCNMGKGTRTPNEFKEYINDLISQTHEGRIISRYFDIKPKTIEFYYETENEVSEHGAL